MLCVVCVSVTVPAAPSAAVIAVNGALLAFGNGGVSVSVTSVASGNAATGGNDITSYTATCTGVSAVNGAWTTTTTTIPVSGLAGGTAVTCTVTATNSKGASTASAVSNSVTPGSTHTHPT